MSIAAVALIVVLLVPSLVMLFFFRPPRWRGALSPERTPTRPPATPRLVPIGGCRECGAFIGQGHTGYCSKSKMRGGPGDVVTEADCRHLTVGDMGMG